MPRLIDADALLAEYDAQHEGPPGMARALIENAPTVNGWISVKDRMPDKNGQYLCWFGKNTIDKGAAIATYLEMWKAFGSLESLETYPNVTHWMPLPEPPKENEDGNRK